MAGYDVYRGTTLVGSVTGTRYTATGLTAATTYSFTVRAKDVAGNVSAASAAVSATTTTATTTTATTTGACSATYTANSWSTGFTATVKVTNTGTTAINGWTLAFTFPSGQVLTGGWSATWSQTGTAVTAQGPAWNSSLAPGMSTEIGFQGTHPGTNTAPVTFSLNGGPCAAG